MRKTEEETVTGKPQIKTINFPTANYAETQHKQMKLKPLEPTKAQMVKHEEQLLVYIQEITKRHKVLKALTCNLEGSRISSSSPYEIETKKKQRLKTAVLGDGYDYE